MSTPGCGLSGVYGGVGSAYRKPTNPFDGSRNGAPGQGLLIDVISAARDDGSLNHAPSCLPVGEKAERTKNRQPIHAAMIRTTIRMITVISRDRRLLSRVRSRFTTWTSQDGFNRFGDLFADARHADQVVHCGAADRVDVVVEGFQEGFTPGRTNAGHALQLADQSG